MLQLIFLAEHNNCRMSEIILIAACSQQKSQTVRAYAKIQNTRAKDYTERHLDWVKSLTEQTSKVSAGDLYIGQYWQVIRQIQSLLHSRRIEIQTSITSAGCGLLTSEDQVPNYAATFQAGAIDQVYTTTIAEASRREYARRWWHDTNQALRDFKKCTSFFELVTPDTKIIISMVSSMYLDVIGADLYNLQLERPDIEFLIFAPKKDPALKSLEGHIPLEVDLIKKIGGSRVSLSARMALDYLSSREDLSAVSTRDCLEYFKQQVAQHGIKETFDRVAVDDATARSFIRKRLQLGSKHYSPILREFRDLGYACEMKRFRGLFNEEIQHDQQT
jgi:hypothetical protein